MTTTSEAAVPDLLTPAQLQEAMLAKSREVDTAISEYRQMIMAHVEADRQKRIAMNTALLAADGATAGERKAKAEQASEEHIYAEAHAAARREVAKEALRARLAQLSAVQSMATTIREEMRLAR